MYVKPKENIEISGKKITIRIKTSRIYFKEVTIFYSFHPTPPSLSFHP